MYTKYIIVHSWLVYYYFAFLIYLPCSIGFLSSWSKDDQEESDLAVDELIIRMFTSHIIAFHSPLCLFCIQTLFPQTFKYAVQPCLGDGAKYTQLELLRQGRKQH